jgi:hypothetical protein
LWFERIGVGEQNVFIERRHEAEPVAAQDLSSDFTVFLASFGTIG